MEDIEILEKVIKEIEANGDFDTIDNPIEVAKAISNLIAKNKELENRIPTEAIEKKIQEYKGLKEIDMQAYEEQIKPLKELLNKE